MDHSTFLPCAREQASSPSRKPHRERLRAVGLKGCAYVQGGSQGGDMSLMNRTSLSTFKRWSPDRRGRCEERQVLVLLASVTSNCQAFSQRSCLFTKVICSFSVFHSFPNHKLDSYPEHSMLAGELAKFSRKQQASVPIKQRFAPTPSQGCV